VVFREVSEHEKSSISAGNLVVADRTLLSTVVSQTPMKVAFNIDEQIYLDVQAKFRAGKIPATLRSCVGFRGPWRARSRRFRNGGPQPRPGRMVRGRHVFFAGRSRPTSQTGSLLTVQESPSAIAAPSPLPDQVARRYGQNRQDRCRTSPGRYDIRLSSPKMRFFRTRISKYARRRTPVLTLKRKPIIDTACRQSFKLATISSICRTVRLLRVSVIILRKCFLASKPDG